MKKGGITMRSIVTLILIAVVLFLIVFGFKEGCSRNVDEVKANAEAVFNQAGFEIVGYMGYRLDSICGGDVWYTLRKINDTSGIIYSAYIIKWFDEYHIYDIEAIDAVKPQVNKRDNT